MRDLGCLLLVLLLFGASPTADEKCPRVSYGGDPYHVEVIGPEMQRCNLAENARKQYREPTEAELSSLRPDQLLIMVRTGAPRMVPFVGLQGPAPVVRVVLRAKAQIVQPVEVTPVPQAWGNAYGAQMQTMGADVWLPWDELPVGDFEVIVVSAAGDHKHTVKGDKRRKLR